LGASHIMMLRRTDGLPDPAAFLFIGVFY